MQLALHGRPGASACYRDYLDAMAQRPEGLDASGHGDWVRSVLAAFERFRLLCAGREGEWGAAGLTRAAEAALTDPAYRENAQKLAGGFRRCGGAAEAADAIEHAVN